MTKPTPAAIWLNLEPRHIQNSKAIRIMLSTLSPIDESCFPDFKAIWGSMNRLFGHLYSEQLIMRAIAESRFWPLLLDGLK